MSGFTHAVVGANAIWIAALVGRVDPYAGALIAAGAFAGLLPDIDAVYSKVQFMFGGLLRPFRIQGSGLWQHRGIAHSFFAGFLVLVLSFIFLRSYHPMLPFVLFFGYMSHPIIDGFNTIVGYFFPFYNQRVTFLPRLLWSRVGGPVDQLFFFLGVMSLLAFLLAFRTTIFQVPGTRSTTVEIEESFSQ